MTKKVITISDLYGKPRDITELVVPVLKDKVFIDEMTKGVYISPSIIGEKTRTKTLLYLLTKKVIKANFPDIDVTQYGTSAKSVIDPLYINKAQADSAFNTLKKEGVIDSLERDGKELLYHIPDHKVLYVVDIINTNKK